MEQLKLTADRHRNFSTFEEFRASYCEIRQIGCGSPIRSDSGFVVRLASIVQHLYLRLSEMQVYFLGTALTDCCHKNEFSMR